MNNIYIYIFSNNFFFFLCKLRKSNETNNFCTHWYTPCWNRERKICAKELVGDTVFVLSSSRSIIIIISCVIVKKIKRKYVILLRSHIYWWDRFTKWKLWQQQQFQQQWKNVYRVKSKRRRHRIGKRERDRYRDRQPERI